MVEISTRFRAPRSDRRSSHIKRKPASNIWHAFNMAAHIGRPFTTLATINFAHTHCPDDRASAALCRLLNHHFAPWWRRPSRGIAPGPYAFAWVLEAAGGCVAAHIVLHMPNGRLTDFAARLPKWVATVTGGAIAPQAVDIRTAPNPNGLRLYFMKGAEKAYAAFCNDCFTAVPQGIIVGKRSGFSRSLGPTMRRQMHYKSGWRRR